MDEKKQVFCLTSSKQNSLSNDNFKFPQKRDKTVLKLKLSFCYTKIDNSSENFHGLMPENA